MPKRRVEVGILQFSMHSPILACLEAISFLFATQILHCIKFRCLLHSSFVMCYYWLTRVLDTPLPSPNKSPMADLATLLKGAAGVFAIKIIMDMSSTWFVVGLLVLLVSFLGFRGFYLIATQEQVLYQPNPALGSGIMGRTPAENAPFFRSPTEHDLFYENLYLTAADGTRLHAWFIPVTSPASATSAAAAAAAASAASVPSAAPSTLPTAVTAVSRTVPTLVFFHENAGNMGMRLPNLRLLSTRLCVNIFVLSYRGYGESAGVPSEPGLIMDADAALQHIGSRSDIDLSRVFLFGRSLGGAVAVAAAVRHPSLVRGVIVENTFCSISALVDSLFPIFTPIKDKVLRLRWHTDKRVPLLTAPFCVLTSTNDEMIPAAHGEVLIEEAVRSTIRVRHSPPPLCLLHYRTLTHGTDLSLSQALLFTLVSFIVSCPSPPSLTSPPLSSQTDGCLLRQWRPHRHLALRRRPLPRRPPPLHRRRLPLRPPAWPQGPLGAACCARARVRAQ